MTPVERQKIIIIILIMTLKQTPRIKLRNSQLKRKSLQAHPAVKGSALVTHYKITDRLTIQTSIHLSIH